MKAVYDGGTITSSHYSQNSKLRRFIVAENGHAKALRCAGLSNYFDL